MPPAMYHHISLSLETRVTRICKHSLFSSRTDPFAFRIVVWDIMCILALGGFWSSFFFWNVVADTKNKSLALLPSNEVVDPSEHSSFQGFANWTMPNLGMQSGVHCNGNARRIHWYTRQNEEKFAYNTEAGCQLLIVPVILLIPWILKWCVPSF